MKRKLTSILLTTSMILMSVATTLAGGPFESFDITNAGPSPIAGHVLARVIPIKWDPRTIPVPYRVNNTLDPIPNPLGAPFLTVAAGQRGHAGIAQCLELRSQLPTSTCRLLGTTNNPA